MQAAPGRPPAQVQSAAQGWQEGAGGVLAAASPPHSREQSRHQPERGSRAAGTPCLRCVPVSPFPKGISSYGHGMAPARLSPGPARPGPGRAPRSAAICAPLRAAPLLPCRGAQRMAGSPRRCGARCSRGGARPGPARPLGSAPRADSPGPAPLRSALRPGRGPQPPAPPPARRKPGAAPAPPPAPAAAPARPRHRSRSRLRRSRGCGERSAPLGEG